MMERFAVETVFENERHSCAKVILHGPGKEVVNGVSTNTYHLVSGLALFSIYLNEEGAVRGRIAEKVILKPGEFITIEPGTTYRDWGSDAVMYCLSEPPFDPESVTVVE